MKKIVYIILLFLIIACNPSENKLELVQKTKLKIKEPSDIALNTNTQNTFFVVSDRGSVYEIDENGSIIKKAKNYQGEDNEAVFYADSKVYTIEERERKLNIFNDSLVLEKTIDLPYSGESNSAYESLTYNEAKKCFIVITEKKPIILMEYDSNFKKINEVKLDFTTDISAATYYNNYLWLLSDKDKTLFKINPNIYSIENQWKIPVENPEGVVFKPNGNILILSDEKGMLYEFLNPEVY